MNIKFSIIVIIFMFFGVMCTGAINAVSAGEIMVIANPDVSAERLDQDAIMNIFLGKIVQWQNGEMVTIVVTEKAGAHEAFLKKYVKRTKNQFNNVWRQNLFTGRGKQPVKVDSLDELVKYVSKVKGAIGYVTSDVPLSGDVKVVSR